MASMAFATRAKVSGGSCFSLCAFSKSPCRRAAVASLARRGRSFEYTSDERLWEIVRGLESLGIVLSNPHSYILEDKGARVLSADLQLEFKREADPFGLLNPGKMSRYTA